MRKNPMGASAARHKRAYCLEPRVASTSWPVIAVGGLTFWLLVYGFFPDNLFPQADGASWTSFNTSHGLSLGVCLLALTYLGHAIARASTEDGGERRCTFPHRLVRIVGAASSIGLAIWSIALVAYPSWMSRARSLPAGILLGAIESGIVWWAIGAHIGIRRQLPGALALSCIAGCCLLALCDVLAPRPSAIPTLVAGLLLSIFITRSPVVPGIPRRSATTVDLARRLLAEALSVLPCLPASLACGALSVVAVGSFSPGGTLALDSHLVPYLGLAAGSCICLVCLNRLTRRALRAVVVAVLVGIATVLLVMPGLGPAPMAPVELIITALFAVALLLSMGLSSNGSAPAVAMATIAALSRICLLVGMWLRSMFGVQAGTDVARIASMWFVLGYLVLVGALLLTARILAERGQNATEATLSVPTFFSREAAGGVPVVQANATDSTQEICSRIARERGLSPREGEVFGYLARGRDVGFISTHLNLSKDTVREYVKGVYAKLDIHSRQDVIDLVESERCAPERQESTVRR